MVAAAVTAGVESCIEMILLPSALVCWIIPVPTIIS